MGFWDSVRRFKEYNTPYDYKAEELKKRKADRKRKNERNRRGRTQTQGAGLGAVSNILGG